MSDRSDQTRRELHRREHLNTYRFLTFSCYKQLPLFNNSAIRDAFAARLARARELYRFRLIAWVIMPEHVHMLIVPRPIIEYRDGLPMVAGAADVTEITWGLKKPFADSVIKRWKRLNARILPRLLHTGGTHRFWQTGGGFDRNTRTDKELWKEIRYTHQNPVVAELVTSAEDWPWSSARWYAGVREGQIPIDFDPLSGSWHPSQQWIDESVPIDPRET